MMYEIRDDYTGEVVAEAETEDAAHYAAQYMLDNKETDSPLGIYGPDGEAIGLWSPVRFTSVG